MKRLAVKSEPYLLPVQFGFRLAGTDQFVRFRTGMLAEFAVLGFPSNLILVFTCLRSAFPGFLGVWCQNLERYGAALAVDA